MGYYIICAAYAGIHSSFIFIWLIGTVGFGGLFAMRFLTLHRIFLVPVWFQRIVFAVCIAGFAVFVCIEGLIISKMVQPVQYDCEYIVILGCQVRGTHITKSLRKRLDRAISYIEAAEQQTGDKKPVQIIVSGGQGNGELIAEADAMRQYLIEHGISEERITCENQSTNTDENFRYSMKLIDNPQAKTGIVTNNFHIYRSLKLAKAKGLENPVGIPADSDSILFINYMVRESIGIVKDFVMGNFQK